MRGKRHHQRKPPTGRQGQPYTVTQAARLLGKNVDEIRRMVSAGDIPAQRVGRRYVIPGEPLLALLTDTPSGVAA